LSTVNQPGRPRAGCIVVGVFEGRKLTPAAQALDAQSRGHISEVLKGGDLEGKVGGTLLLHKVPRVGADRILLVGLGRERNFTEAPFRAALEEMVAQRRTARGEYWLADALQIFIDRGARLRTFPVQHWYDCGTPEALLRANHALLENTPPPREIPGTSVIPPSSIAESAVVLGSVIGPYVTIAEGAHVVNSVLRESIVNAHARVERVVLEESIIGENATVKGRQVRINIGDSSEIELA